MDLLPILCIFIEILLRINAQGEKSLNEFNFGTFMVPFLSDSPACMAVKGLIVLMVSVDVKHGERKAARKKTPDRRPRRQ